MLCVMVLLHASWSKLNPELQRNLHDKLRGIYGFETSDAEIFDWLEHDKQLALQLLTARFVELKVWRFVLRVTNVYGVGGTGIEFVATDDFAEKLSRRRDFTSRFARHTGAHRGFYERHRSHLSLHLLEMNHANALWSAHYDLHSPVASPSSLWRHLWHERLRGATPAAEEIIALINADNRRC